jgi:hypothetical protein
VVCLKERLAVVEDLELSEVLTVLLDQVGQAVQELYGKKTTTRNPNANNEKTKTK